MDNYQLGKDIQQITERLNRLESQVFGVESREGASTLGRRLNLAVHNHTLTDLHIHWTQDVHEDDKWDFIPNGHSKERTSRKVDEDATFRIEVYRNDNGSVGAFIGAFNQVVSYVVGREEIELIRKDNKLYRVSASQIIQYIAEYYL